jgi:hypothetical protein
MTDAPARLATCLVAFVACLCGACAGTGSLDTPPQGPGTVRTPTGLSLAPQAAMDTIAIGKSTKDDVSSALGKAIVIRFDSGYEVWVYRWAGPERTTRAATELVVLFAPSGLATKARVRPGYPTHHGTVFDPPERAIVDSAVGLAGTSPPRP